VTNTAQRIPVEQRAREYARMQRKTTQMHRDRYESEVEADFIAGWEAYEKQLAKQD
jgi:hypothetical protein